MRRITIESDGRESQHCLRKLQFSADGRILSGLLGGQGECPTVFRYDLIADRELELPATEDDWEITREEAQIDPCVSRDGEIIVEVLRRESGYRGLRIMDVWSKPLGLSWIMHDDSQPLPTAMTFSDDCETLWTVGLIREDDAETLSAWQVQDLIELENPIPDRILPFVDGKTKSETAAIALSASQRFLVRSCLNGRLELSNLKEREMPLVLLNGEAAVQRSDSPKLLFAPNESSLCVADDAGIALWTTEGRALATIPAGPNDVACYSADSQRILVSDTDGDIIAYGVADGRELSRLNFGLGRVTGLAFAPDGLTAAAGLTDGTIVIWDV